MDAVAAIPAVQVGVKPLEWDGGSAASPWGAYAIMSRDCSQCHVDYAQLYFNGTLLLEKHGGTDDEMKLAAQADYEARIRSALTAQPSPDEAALVDYVLQDDLHNRLTPRVVDIAYSAFMLGRRGKNKDDGGPCDWVNDTKPMVDAKIAEIRAALARLKGGA